MDMAACESFSQRVLRDMNAAVLVLDRKGYILYINRPASEMLELDIDLKPGQLRFPLSTDNDRNDEFYEYILNALYDKSETHVGHVHYESPSGRVYTVRLSSSYLDAPEKEDTTIVITISDETKEAELQRKVRDSSMTFSTFLFGLSVWFIIYALWDFMNRPTIMPDMMTHGIELLGLIMAAFIYCRTSLTWQDLGILPKNWGKTIKTTLIVTVCAVAFLFLLKGIARLINPNSFEPDAPFFDVGRFGILQITYILTSGIQEFLARCVIQGNLRRIMTGKYRGVLAIVLSTMLFSAMHLHLGFIFMMGAAILAGLEGILYEKQQNIIGTWIVHWTFGVVGTLLCLVSI